MQAALLCPSSSREEERVLPARGVPWPGVTPALREQPCNEAMQKTAVSGHNATAGCIKLVSASL